MRLRDPGWGVRYPNEGQVPGMELRCSGWGLGACDECWVAPMGFRCLNGVQVLGMDFRWPGRRPEHQYRSQVPWMGDQVHQ